MPYADPAARREYARLWMASRRAEWLAEHGPCGLCGSTDDLEIDHIDPDRKVSHRVWSWSAARREAELSKCQVLCRGCHAAKSGRERAREIEHGRPSTYDRAGCRCGPCRHGKLIYKRGGRAFWERWVSEGCPIPDPLSPDCPLFEAAGPVSPPRSL